MSAPSFRAYPQSAVEAGDLRADALVSITGHGYRRPGIDETRFGGRVLRLAFDDIPGGTWEDHAGKLWAGPTDADLRAALDFGRAAAAAVPGASVALHCLHGKSRSAGIALMLAADSLGPGREAEAVAALLSGAGRARVNPNPGIVRFADRELSRAGAIERALEAACPRFVTWRAYWETRVPGDPGTPGPASPS